MKTFTSWMMVTALALTLGCGKKSESSTVDTYVSGMDKIAEAVEQVNDEAGARQAAQVIEAVRQDLEKTMSAMEAMSDTQKAMAFAQRASDLQKVQMRLATAMQSLAARPDLMRIIGDEMGKMPQLQ